MLKKEADKSIVSETFIRDLCTEAMSQAVTRQWIPAVTPDPGLICHSEKGLHASEGTCETLKSTPQGKARMLFAT